MKINQIAWIMVINGSKHITHEKQFIQYIFNVMIGQNVLADNIMCYKYLFGRSKTSSNRLSNQHDAIQHLFIIALFTDVVSILPTNPAKHGVDLFVQFLGK